MKVCILQPSYIPWKGFFHQIQKSDVFVFFDTVQYDRRGWRNRNLIKTPQGPKWLTIPVHAKGTHDGLKIQDVQVQTQDWAKAHLQTIQTNYRKAPFFQTEFPWLEALLTDTCQSEERIARITATVTEAIARRIGIETTHFMMASEMGVDTDEPTERLLKIVQALNGTTYLSGPSAKNYMDVERFDAAGIDIEWMTYDYPQYPQLYPPFTHQVSIVDLLMMVGAEQARQYIWDVPPEIHQQTAQEEARCHDV